MYSAFNLIVKDSAAVFEAKLTEVFIERGRETQKTNRDAARASLESLLNDKIISGNKLSNHWFPQIKADVFISHSHQDEEEAIRLAGILKVVFGLEPFIDSCVWGHSEELLRMIDDKYCLRPGSETYDYHKRNGSTSHIHMMLSTALSTMMDSTECILFLNTPNSITSRESVDKTSSPWLFFELGTISILRRRKPERMLTESFATKTAELKIRYDVELDELTELDELQWLKWMATPSIAELKQYHPLDLLYALSA